MMKQQNNSLCRRAQRAGLILTLMAAIAGTATGVQAGDHQKKAQELAAIRTAVQKGEILPLPRIVALAQTRVPGDVIKTELEAKRARLIYEIKIMTVQGNVQEVKLDARTGKVLRVEDDPIVGMDLVQPLTEAGFLVDLSTDGEDAWYRGDVEDYALAVLDLDLPKLDGLNVLKRWRAEERSFPVLVLSARGDWTEKVEGIQAGAR